MTEVCDVKELVKQMKSDEAARTKPYDEYKKALRDVGITITDETILIGRAWDKANQGDRKVVRD